MGHTTPLTASRYPDGSDSPNIAQYIQNLGLDLEDNTVPYFANTTARDAAYANFVAAGGVMRDYLTCSVSGIGYQTYLSGSWQSFGGDTGWQNISLASPFTTATEGAHYRVKQGICYLQADILNNSAWSFGATVFTLPLGARPITSQFPPVMKVSGTTRTGTTLGITSAGVAAIGVAGGATDNIVICVSFPVD